MGFTGWGTAARKSTTKPSTVAKLRLRWYHVMTHSINRRLMGEIPYCVRMCAINLRAPESFLNRDVVMLGSKNREADMRVV